MAPLVTQIMLLKSQERTSETQKGLERSSCLDVKIHPILQATLTSPRSRLRRSDAGSVNIIRSLVRTPDSSNPLFVSFGFRDRTWKAHDLSKHWDYAIADGMECILAMARTVLPYN